MGIDEISGLRLVSSFEKNDTTKITLR